MVQRTTRYLIVLGALLLIALAFAARPATAQSTGQIELLGLELERTDQLLARARAEISQVRNTFSHQRLDEAHDLQRRARRAYQEGAGGTEVHGAKLKESRALTLKARELAIKAIEAAGIEKRSRESVRATIERAQIRSAELVGAIEACDNPLATQLFEQGLQQLRRARRALQGSDPRAIRLAGLALELIERAGRIALGEGPLPEAVAAAIERSEQLVAQVAERLSSSAASGELRALLDEAERLLSRARAELRSGHLRFALRLSLQAREKALQVLARLKHAPSETELLAALADLEALHDQLAADIGRGAASAARDLLRRAQRMMGDARRFVAAEKPQEALTMLVAAETLLHEAAEAAGLR
jgi:HEPN domain-containing protein